MFDRREGDRGVNQGLGDAGFRDLRQVIFHRVRLVVLIRISLSRGPVSVVLAAATVGVLQVRVDVALRTAGGDVVVQRQVPGNQELLQGKTHTGERSNEHSSCDSSPPGNFSCLCHHSRQSPGIAVNSGLTLYPRRCGLGKASSHKSHRWQRAAAGKTRFYAQWLEAIPARR